MGGETQIAKLVSCRGEIFDLIKLVNPSSSQIKQEWDTQVSYTFADGTTLGEHAARDRIGKGEKYFLTFYFDLSLPANEALASVWPEFVATHPDLNILPEE